MSNDNLKIPPHDLEIEKSVLSSIMIDEEAFIRVADFIDEDAFYSPKHKIIYHFCQQLYENHEPVDILTLTNILKKNKKLTQIGGATYLAELNNFVTTSSNVAEYAKLLSETAIRRKMITLSNDLNGLSFNESIDLKDILQNLEQKVFSLSQFKGEKDFVHIKDILVESFERLDELQKNAGSLRGLPTGFTDLDNILGGLQKSNLLILAARPGMGKTAFALNIARNLAVYYKKKVGIFSLEMSKEELIDRLIVAQADVDAFKYKMGHFSDKDDQDLQKISEAMGILAEAEIYIDETPGISIYDIRTRARKLMFEHQIEVLIIDYLQLAHGQTKDNRVQEVSEISQGCKNLARELKIPVIALSQLSREVEKRVEKTPQLSDLRESGSIEQDADVVMFLHYEDKDFKENVKLKIAKHRNGALGSIDLYFKGDRLSFFGIDKKIMEE